MEQHFLEMGNKMVNIIGIRLFKVMRDYRHLASFGRRIIQFISLKVLLIVKCNRLQVTRIGTFVMFVGVYQISKFILFLTR